MLTNAITRTNTTPSIESLSASLASRHPQSQILLSDCSEYHLHLVARSLRASYRVTMKVFLCSGTKRRKQDWKQTEINPISNFELCCLLLSKRRACLRSHTHQTLTPRPSLSLYFAHFPREGRGQNMRHCASPEGLQPQGLMNPEAGVLFC